MPKQALLTLSAIAALCALAMLSVQARAAGQEGMVVKIENGQKVLPSAADMKALRDATPPGAAALTGKPPVPLMTITRPNGARGVRVGESHLVYDVVTRGADGKLSSQCVQGEAAVEQALAHPANAADQESDHETR